MPWYIITVIQGILSTSERSPANGPGDGEVISKGTVLALKETNEIIRTL